MKTKLCFVYGIITILFFNLFISSSFASPIEPDISAEAAILIEIDSGEILYEKNANAPMYPASTTKIMTALLALEHLNLEDKITVPEDMGPADGSAMYLLPGEVFTVRELLDGLLVKSANDAAVLLARTISGDIQSFATLMNQRAKDIGCTNTSFANPNGLHDPSHTISAHDMALIAREAMKNATFRELVSQVNVTLDETPQTPEKRYFRNTNRFLWSTSKIIYNNEYIPIKYEVVDGIKTGYTGEAGNCLVSSGKKNNIRVISVVFKASGYDVYRDSRLLLDYGFDNFEKKTLIKKDTVLGSQPINYSSQGSLEYGTKEDFVVPYLKSSLPVYNTKIMLNDLKLPISKGDIVGKLVISNDKSTNELTLFALNNVESIFNLNFIKQIFTYNSSSILKYLGYSLSSLFVLFIGFRYYVYCKRKKRLKRKSYRKLY
ncbi:D-alanyl-D-alanine carboxypeptidase (penicillin-binding protein 5/6) [Acetoanaerobium noterae]|uniref:serine-type D-Ala-D-Ala carboxypeptidase n=2 Tax=root TaxID=1 RepID=A0A1T5CIJ6_9FIRM|nr:D-alanyl-D-alanine carboxypeptidase family protein [Acetoanaerobium noterae]SKB59305.1 D-alanyl-D-alanine carboxypeptidase (penicillin-binding protein 5/6) [Acetoanaerobium noterae]